jgi:hypothetical protein
MILLAAFFGIIGYEIGYRQGFNDVTADKIIPTTVCENSQDYIKIYDTAESFNKGIPDRLIPCKK